MSTPSTSFPRLLWQRATAGFWVPSAAPTWVIDTALAAGVSAISLGLLSHGGLALAHTRTPGLTLTQTLLALGGGMPLIGWRRWPLAVFTVIGAVSVAFAARGVVLLLPVGLATALYLLASGREGGQRWTPAGVWVAGVLVVYVGVLTFGSDLGASDDLHVVLACGVGWFAGERTRLRHAQFAELRERAERSERSAARERDLAIAEERTRIARDLHDSVAHALNVITVRAGAARLRRDTLNDRAALDAIEDLARQTMADIDQFVGSLRSGLTDDGHVETPPGLAALDTLLSQHKASRHRVQLDRRGQDRRLSVPVDHGAYRILQEALTNAARYGTGTTTVQVAYEPDGLDLTVSNTVNPTPPPTTNSGGHGLIGIHERAAMLGGESTAGAAAGRFVVHARLPYAGRSS